VDRFTRQSPIGSSPKGDRPNNKYLSPPKTVICKNIGYKIIAYSVFYLTEINNLIHLEITKLSLDMFLVIVGLNHNPLKLKIKNIIIYKK